MGCEESANCESLPQRRGLIRDSQNLRTFLKTGLKHFLLGSDFTAVDPLVGVINVQHRESHQHSRREIPPYLSHRLSGGRAEIEMARMESENEQLAHQLETRKLMEQAKGLLQRELNH